MNTVHITSVGKDSFASAISWGAAWKLALIAILLGTLFVDVLADMAHEWWVEPAWSQGMLLPPLAAYLAWIQRRQTLDEPATPDRRGLLLIAFACVLFLLGTISAEFFLRRISFVFLLTGLIWTFWGGARLKTLSFPLLLLAVMVPLPALVYNSLATPLQLLASDWATRTAGGLGVSVFRDGNIIQLADISLGVAEACSGLNSLSALLVGSLLVGHLSCERLVSRVALIALALPVAIGINIIRVAGTAVLADYDQQYALGFYHSFSGWLVFLGGFGILCLLAKGLHLLLDHTK